MLVAVSSYSEPAGHLAGAPGPGICTFRADGDGRLTPTGAAPLLLRQPSYLVRHPTLQVLYSTCETEGWEGIGDEGSAVAAVAFDSSSGALTQLSLLGVRGAAACHLSTDGEFLYVACYLPFGGKGQVHMISLAADGSLGNIGDTAEFVGASDKAGADARGGLDADRQEASHPHMAYLYRSAGGGDFLLVPDLGADKVHRLQVDRAAKKLVPAGDVSIAIGSGPRHCVVNSAGTIAYVLSELMSTVDVVDLETMASVQRLSTLPAEVDLSHNVFFKDVVKQSESSAIRLSPDGGYLYASNRGHDSIAIYKVSAADGRLESGGQVKTGGLTPRDFFVSPDGRYLLAMNQDTGDIRRLVVCPGAEVALEAASDDAPVAVGAPVCMIAL
eukprot:TRINITY_DN34069_c0_g1_i1.p1 TRINITY_DN34069_c0_g1~~TRINITY_DN34069_c0_g1_i1.p1  ORF type:complete len:386 (-),score=82.87 TRINITY_DN34069_c0_g1_i1:385-1542(-)